MVETYNGRQVMNAIEETARNFRYPNYGGHGAVHRTEVYVELEDGEMRLVTGYASGQRNFVNEYGYTISLPTITFYAGIPVESDEAHEDEEPRGKTAEFMCAKCGHQWTTDNSEEPCPKCGDTGENDG